MKSSPLLNIIGLPFTDERVTSVLVRESGRSDGSGSMEKPKRFSIGKRYGFYWYLEYHEAGFSVMFDKDKCASAIHLRGDGQEGYSDYTGDAPFGLRMGDTIEQVLAKAPSPALVPRKSAGGNKDKFGTYIRKCWNFYLGESRVHCSFAQDTERLCMITLMAGPEPAPAPDDDDDEQYLSVNDRR